MQSISKVFALLHVLERRGESNVFKRIGKEPTGDPFNADPRVRAKGDVRIPYNPMINVGAIFITSLFPGSTRDDRFNGFLDFVRLLCADDGMIVDEAVYRSEKATGHNNRALAWKMNADGIFLSPDAAAGDPSESRAQDVDFIEDVLDTYFRQCSILVTADHLARAACVLATGGIDPTTGNRVATSNHVQTVVSLMATCGVYDGSGEFLYDIGIPAKSGVAGGIMCVVPSQFGIAAFSPALDSRGNSERGIYMLKRLSREAGLHIFRPTRSPVVLRTYTGSVPLQELVTEIKFGDALPDLRAADYIPELGASNALDTGVAICDCDGTTNGAGDYRRKFTLQSISNLFALLYVLNKKAEGRVFRHVGKEPSGEPFHALKWQRFEEASSKRQIPFNPMINAGAIVVASMIPEHYDERSSADGLVEMDDFTAFVRRLCGNDEIRVNQDVFESERRTGFKNRSLAWLMNDKGVFREILNRQKVDTIDHSVVEDILSVYFRMCAIEVDCQDLARFGALLAKGGKDLETGEDVIPTRHAIIVMAMMAGSGLYEGSGEFAASVGIPAKTGVSGGVVGVVPGTLGIAAYGPVIDEKGNTYRGQEILRRISEIEGLSVFRCAASDVDSRVAAASE